MKDRIVQLTPEQRARLDEEAAACAAELLSDDPPLPSGLRGAALRVARKIVAGARRARRAWTRDNLDAALAASKRFAGAAAEYGTDVLRDAVIRRVKRELEDTITGVVEGKPGKPR